MSELTDALWVEKYRPSTFEDLICSEKETIKKYLDSKSVPSFLFYSSNPGTGKTSTAKVICKTLDSDLLQINASDERGIDTIRDKIKQFAQSISSNDKKRCVFLDESDGLTKQAQESMKSLMEMYSSNCFFILCCNDVSKIIEPIREGRCVKIKFECPNSEQILDRLNYICEKEDIKTSPDELANLVEAFYPDIRSMILNLQNAKLTGIPVGPNTDKYKYFLRCMKKKDIESIYKTTFSGDFDIRGFVKYYMALVFENHNKVNLNRLCYIANLLADIEKNWAIGVHMETVFLANIMEIIRTAP